MKTLTTIFLLFAIATLLVVGPSANENDSQVQSGKIEHLTSFAKLYGYIRYFHPSDEAASIDWNKFLYHGIEEVIKARDSVELLNTLDSLFLPIAPTVDIFFSGETPRPLVQPENIDSLVLVTWQHEGVGADPNWLYKSIRINRLDWAFCTKFGLWQQSYGGFDCGNKRFKLSGVARAANNGKAQIELVGFALTGKYFQRSVTIENEDLEPFVVEDTIDEGISHLLLSIRLLEKGELLIEDLQFQLEDSAGTLQPFSITNRQFITENQDELEDTWNYTGLGLKYDIAGPAHKTSITFQSTDEFEYNSLFDKHCQGNELITKDLGSGISCRLPLALYLPPEQPVNFSESFMNLQSKLEQIQLEQISAESAVTRIGVVITAWSIFQHFYPYFDEVDVDWDNVLTQTLAEVQNNRDVSDFLVSLRKMTAPLEDGHVKVTHPSEGGLKALPVILDYIEGQIVVVATGSDQLQNGDVVVEIDGKPAPQLLSDYEKTVSGSPQWKKCKALRDFTLDDSTRISEVKVRREGEVVDVMLDRKLTPPQYTRPDNVSEIADNVYYVNLCQASMDEIESRIEDISNAKGVVFDLRGYPNSNHDVISYMIDDSVQCAKWNVPFITYPDHENVVGYDTSLRWSIQPRQPRIQGKIVFLTDKSAISYSETVMGIIEHYNLADIVGSTTAGVNGNVNSATTMGGFGFQWTGLKTLKHDDSQHHLVGIKPTIPVEPTIDGIREGRDEVLEKGIEIASK